jgi:hypothetical protein
MMTPQDIDEAFLRWHETQLHRCATDEDDGRRERVIVDYLVALALAPHTSPEQEGCYLAA